MPIDVARVGFTKPGVLLTRGLCSEDVTRTPSSTWNGHFDFVIALVVRSIVAVGVATLGEGRQAWVSGRFVAEGRGAREPSSGVLARVPSGQPSSSRTTSSFSGSNGHTSIRSERPSPSASGRSKGRARLDTRAGR